MNDLLKIAIEAHGGLDRWNKYNKVKIHMLVGGMLWGAKGHPGLIADTGFEVELHQQRGRYINFENKIGQDTYFSPDRVAIIDNGQTKAELLHPRESFNGYQLETPWSKLQLIYFGTYAMWSYLTTPFLFMLPGFATREIDPWHEGGETWRRLQVIYPDGFAYHSKEQILYFDVNGFLKRLDYSVDISGGVPAAHYVFDYKEFNGMMVPTRRLVYPRDDNNQYMNEPLVVEVMLKKVEFR